MCQRTYEKSYDLDTAPGATDTLAGIYNHIGSPASATSMGIVPSFKVPKLAVPTITVYDMVGNARKLSSWNGSTQTNNITATADQVTTTKFRVLAGVASGNYELFGHYTAECDL